MSSILAGHTGASSSDQGGPCVSVTGPLLPESLPPLPMHIPTAPDLCGPGLTNCSAPSVQRVKGSFLSLESLQVLWIDNLSKLSILICKLGSTVSALVHCGEEWASGRSPHKYSFPPPSHLSRARSADDLWASASSLVSAVPWILAGNVLESLPPYWLPPCIQHPLSEHPSARLEPC